MYSKGRVNGKTTTNTFDLLENAKLIENRAETK